MGSIGGGGSPEERAAAGGPVCVTGSTGSVGSWLVRALLRRGYRVHATARDPGTPYARARSLASMKLVAW